MQKYKNGGYNNCRCNNEHLTSTTGQPSQGRPFHTHKHTGRWNNQGREDKAKNNMTNVSKTQRKNN